MIIFTIRVCDRGIDSRYDVNVLWCFAFAQNVNKDLGLGVNGRDQVFSAEA